MSDTPRTDAAMERFPAEGAFVLVPLLRELERENAALRAAEKVEPVAHDLPPGFARLHAATYKFRKLVQETNGRIPTERLSFADWNELCRAHDECSVPPANSSPPTAERAPSETSWQTAILDACATHWVEYSDKDTPREILQRLFARAQEDAVRSKTK